MRGARGYDGSMGTRCPGRLLWLNAMLVAVAGCTSPATVSPSAPTAVAQALTLRALERAVKQLDVTPVQDRRVSVDVKAQAGPEPFAKAFIETRLRERGVIIVAENPELTLTILVGVLGTNQGETFVGIPSFVVPLIGFPTPEIALFKWQRNRGLVEVQIYAFDATTTAFASKTALGVGHSRFDNFTVLLVVSFTLDDLEEREPS
jgi:hypothetical protein